MQNLEWTIFYQNMKRYFQRIITVVIIYLILDQLAACSPLIRWPLVTAKRPIYQLLYSVGEEEIPLKEMERVYTPYKDPHPYQVIELNGQKISKTFVTYFRSYGRIAYLDTNDALIKGWFLSSGNKEKAWLYKKVVPYDMSIAYGQLAQPKIFNQVKFGHEENVGFIFSDRVKINLNEFDNIHILPANKRIRQIVSVLKKGDEVYLEGFLTDWDSPTVPREKQWYKTARYVGEKSHQRAGGRLSGLCYQLFLTKIILNGHVYK